MTSITLSRPGPAGNARIPRPGGRLFLFALASILLAAAAPAGAVELREDLWVTDGPVHAIAVDDEAGIVYIGGNFSRVATADDTVGVVRRNLAALDLASGAATAWDPGAIGVVRAMWLAPDGATLYIGGDFLAVGGQFRNRLAALSTANAVPRPWNPSADGPVRTMIPGFGGASVFVGGAFGTVAGATRHGLAEIRVSGDGSLTGLGQVPVTEPGADVHALALGETRLYVGGEFTLAREEEVEEEVEGEVEEEEVRRLAAIDLNSFEVVANWLPQIGDGVIRALHHHPDEAVVYAGGSFTVVEDAPRAGVAAFRASDGAALAWDPQLDGPVSAIASSLDRTALYFGGTFTAVAGVPQAHLAAVSAINGVLLEEWRIGAGAEVLRLVLSEDVEAERYTLFAGGRFETIGAAPRPGLVALEALRPERQPPLTVAEPPGGFFNSNNLTPITLVCDDGGGSGCDTTYYTLDGTDPDEESLVYFGPISVLVDTQVRFFSIDNVGNREPVNVETYEFEIDPPVTTASPHSRVFEEGAFEVTLSCTDAGSGCAVTYYTIDGTIPTTGSTPYTGPIRITGTTVLQYFSVDVAGNIEGVGRSEYVRNRGQVGALAWHEVLMLIALAAGARTGRGRRGHA